MQINRTTILTGPCLITYAGQKFWSKGDVTLKPINERFQVTTAAFGNVDERIRDKRLEVQFEPSGRFTAALAAVLFPYAALDIGASIYGSVDRPLVIHSRSGTKITIVNAALTGMPTIRLSVAQTMQGPCTFTGILKNNTDPTEAEAYYLSEAVEYPGDADFSVSDIKTLAYSSAWGEVTPWEAFLTEAGWEISMAMQTTPQMVDGLGTVDMRLQSLSITASAIPVGPTESDILTAMRFGQTLGGSLATGTPLVITAPGVHVEVRNAGLTDADLGYGAQRKRIGRCQWIATRSVTAGSLDPLFYIGTAEPA